jgi:hypothetical protein
MACWSPRSHRSPSNKRWASAPWRSVRPQRFAAGRIPRLHLRRGLERLHAPRFHRRHAPRPGRSSAICRRRQSEGDHRNFAAGIHQRRVQPPQEGTSERTSGSWLERGSFRQAGTRAARELIPATPPSFANAGSERSVTRGPARASLASALTIRTQSQSQAPRNAGPSRRNRCALCRCLSGWIAFPRTRPLPIELPVHEPASACTSTPLKC